MKSYKHPDAETLCRAVGCIQIVRPGMVFCPTCYAKLPRANKRAIADNYKNPTSAVFLETVRNAQQAISREGAN